MAKRIATLADMIASSKDESWATEPKFVEKVRSKVRSAQRFVFTDVATERVREAIRSNAMLLVDNGQFALTPFPVCWIEFPSAVMQALEPIEVQNFEGRTPDCRTGFLFDGDDVYQCELFPDGSSTVLPICWKLHQSIDADTIDYFEKFFGVDRNMIWLLFWGMGISTRQETLPYLIDFVESHSFELNVSREARSDPQMSQIFPMLAGAVRNIVGFLLTLNQPTQVLQTSTVPASKAISLKGPRSYMAHSIVHIDLGRRKVKTLLDLSIDRRRALRRHSVRAHFRHIIPAGSENCIHSWTQIDAMRWGCEKCEGKRIRIASFERGDAGVGYAHQIRKVDAKNTYH